MTRILKCLFRRKSQDGITSYTYSTEGKHIILISMRNPTALAKFTLQEQASFDLDAKIFTSHPSLTEMVSQIRGLIAQGWKFGFVYLDGTSMDRTADPEEIIHFIEYQYKNAGI
jgi:hypothetical protein